MFSIYEFNSYSSEQISNYNIAKRFTNAMPCRFICLLGAICPTLYSRKILKFINSLDSISLASPPHADLSFTTFANRKKSLMEIGESFFFFMIQDFLFCLNLAYKMTHLHKFDILDFSPLDTITTTCAMRMRSIVCRYNEQARNEENMKL